MPSRSTPPCLRKNVRPYTAGVKRTRHMARDRNVAIANFDLREYTNGRKRKYMHVCMYVCMYVCML